MHPLIAFLALLTELGFGYPDRLLRAVGHPVMWIGWLIALMDRLGNRPEWTHARRRLLGVVALALLLLAALSAGYAIQALLLALPVGIVLLAIVASSLLAQRSLHTHVAAVADALEHQGIDAARKAVSQIVGRDPDRLDASDVARAAVESLAENFSDAVVAPALWIAIGGLAGGLAYKAVNTADSMIGHRNSRYEAFGWASARLDDLLNLPASRLSALLIVVAALAVPGPSACGALTAIRRDSGKHRSPNAGWPEAAMAGALGISIAGPRSYGGVMSKDSPMGDGGRRQLTAADIRAALKLYRIADGILIALLGLLTMGFILLG